MDDCTYNGAKLLHEMSKLAGFIEKHAKKDAKAAKHAQCGKILKHLHNDLTEHMEQLRSLLSKKKIK